MEPTHTNSSKWSPPILTLLNGAHLSIELSNGFFAPLHQDGLLVTGTDYVIRCNAGLARVDALSPHKPLGSHLNGRITGNDAGTMGRCGKDSNKVTTPKGVYDITPYVDVQ